MPHVEQQLVVRAVEQAVTGQRELDHAEARGHMAAVFRGGFKNLGPYFGSQNGKLLVGEELEIRGRRYHIENAMLHTSTFFR